ncbi:glutamyl-tRNA(Gln) amidotransferase [Trichoderma gamsii]|uniref:Glutamyl-tRNA(Gln) amidotransferase n=1 Tax=Trichoderma gamsii TaxID=398673 RepID=A0A2P4ZMA6_9HYPO|nr:glutamyl-tRNA(Gln) amidotransferase [Trichoderma gamsii]PON25427.1 glutamyl-tRNA(Gln) amidotransferase [Trichoderma gamsii]
MKSGEMRLATVFKIPQHEDGLDPFISKHLAEYMLDDVFSQEFLAVVVFIVPRKSCVSKEEIKVLEENGMKEYIFVSSTDYSPGPHVIVDQELREVWKLVEDSYASCMVTLKPQTGPSSALEPFRVTSQDGQDLSFAIPSRIKSYGHASPLGGLRVLIKDNIDLKGIKTSVGNRAFYNTFPPKEESADCVQKLVNSGVVVVGKTKLNSFGNWEEPMEYTDYQAPWNPRADGYQSPGGSSSGSAAAIVAYDCLDIALGTDTWGSITRPAHWCGCFGFRPSIGAISTKGIEPYVQSWDIPGFLARDLGHCREFAAEWLAFDEFEKAPEQFSSIIWPTDYWKIIDAKQASEAKSFAQRAAAKLNVNLVDISFEKCWSASPPTKVATTLQQFINPATEVLAFDVYQNSEKFRLRHEDLFGRAPYTTLQNERIWSAGKAITQKQRDEGFKRINTYREWFQQAVRANENTNAIVIMPIESAEPRYRDEFPEFRRPPQGGINALALGPVTKSPVLAIPIAEVPYHSRVSGQEERLPFAVALMGTPGSDLQLIDTAIEILSHLNLPTVVQTGRHMYKKPEQ